MGLLTFQHPTPSGCIVGSLIAAANAPFTPWGCIVMFRTNNYTRPINLSTPNPPHFFEPFSTPLQSRFDHSSTRLRQSFNPASTRLRPASTFLLFCFAPHSTHLRQPSNLPRTKPDFVQYLPRITFEPKSNNNLRSQKRQSSGTRHTFLVGAVY